MATNEAADIVATEPEKTAGVANTFDVDVNSEEPRSAINDSTLVVSFVGNDQPSSSITLVEATATSITTSPSHSTNATNGKTTLTATSDTGAKCLVKTIPPVVNRKILLCRRFKDSVSLPLFVYATSPSTHAISADGVGVARELSGFPAILHNDKRNQCHADNINKWSPYRFNSSLKQSSETCDAVECMPTTSSSILNPCYCSNPLQMASATTIGGIQTSSGSSAVGLIGSSNGTNMMYPHHLNLNTLPNLQQQLQHQQQQQQPLQHHQLQHQHHLLSHQIPYSNNYHPLHHSNSHHIHTHSEQTKSLQELQHEVGALLEFRDLVIETFPDLKQKMASMSSATSQIATTNNCSVNAHNSNNSNTNSVNSNATTASSSGTTMSSTMRREWEPGIRPKRKGQKDPSSTGATGATAAAQASSSASNNSSSNVTGDNCSSLTRSRSNSHSGKKEPKSGENNNGSVVQDSGFSTETSSSKEGHSASSTNGALPASASNRISAEADDELLNLLDVIHRKSNRLREEVEQLQSYERNTLQSGHVDIDLTPTTSETLTPRPNIELMIKNLNPKTFREHVERLNREDIKNLRKERNRLLEKLAEMEAETLTGRIKAAQMNDRVEELINVKKDLEEQLKLAMVQKLELSSRLQQLQMQQQQSGGGGKSSSSQSESSSHRNFSSTATTVLSNSSTLSSAFNSSQVDSSSTPQQQKQRQNTFQPLVVDSQQHQQQQQEQKTKDDAFGVPFRQSVTGDNNQSQQHEQHIMLGHLDGIVSSPGSRNLKSRTVDSKRFSAILLENNILELKRHLLTLTVQNQNLASKLDKTTKSNSNLFKRLEKQKEDIDDLRFQLEEKNIELEGTKAQLRVVESRYPSATPSSNATTNSYLHSHHDYETNRSSASTTLVLSRRSGCGGSGLDSNLSSDIQRSSTPLTGSSAIRDMPTPVTSQISTPSMKNMVPLPMDDLQQHSSSTESAHDHEITLDNSGGSGARFMSSSVGRMSPFEQTKTLTPTQQALKKFIGGGSKPSKIPLPGSKATSYFAGKPPTGRLSTAGRSPPSANGSYSSNKSLSRSTGNLLYNKSPNTSSTSLSTNTSRSSTNSSSIPLAVTPHSVASRLFASAATTSPASPVSSTITMTTTTPPTPTSTNAMTTTTNAHNPSSRILQNSPLPKLKREIFASRIRQLDPLSRAHYQQQEESNNSNDLSHRNLSNGSNNSSSTPNSSYIVSSTPKPSSIAAQINSSIRKELQLSSSSFSSGTQSILRRPTNANNSTSNNNNSGGVGSGNNSGGTPLLQNQSITARRFSSASIVGARVAAAARNHEQQQLKQHSTSTLQADHNGHQHQNLNQNQFHMQHSNSGNSGNGSNASDSDSGKVRTLKSAFLGWINKF